MGRQGLFSIQERDKSASQREHLHAYVCYENGPDNSTFLVCPRGKVCGIEVGERKKKLYLNYIHIYIYISFQRRRGVDGESEGAGEGG